MKRHENEITRKKWHRCAVCTIRKLKGQKRVVADLTCCRVMLQAIDAAGGLIQVAVKVTALREG